MTIERPARIDRLRRTFADRGVDGVVVRRPPNVRYLTGYPSDYPPGSNHPLFAVVGGDEVALILPEGDDAERARTERDISVFGYATPGGTLDRVADVERLAAAALDAAVEQAGLRGRRIGIEETAISVFHAAAVVRHGPAVAVDGAVEALRRIKDTGEVAAIRTAVGYNDLGFAAAGKAIGPGVSELAVQAAVVRAMQEVAGVPIDVLPQTNAFISGPRAALGAAGATPRCLDRGDLMIIDLNPIIAGYKGDTTRTFSVGLPSPEQQRIHKALVRAIEAAETLLRPGVRACDVYATLVAAITDAGLGTDLDHHGGYAIGLEHLERPYIIPADPTLLAKGMVLTLEPGVYGPDIGGLRIEDNYLITADGCARSENYRRECVLGTRRRRACVG